MDSDLVEFLLARITEDEAANATHKYVLRWAGGPASGQTYLRKEDAEAAVATRLTSAGNRWKATIDSVPRADVPRAAATRMLAECDAKRRIIGCAREALSEHQIGTAKWILTLRSLAAPYSDHPDFDPSWRLDSQ